MVWEKSKAALSSRGGKVVTTGGKPLEGYIRVGDGWATASNPSGLSPATRMVGSIMLELVDELLSSVEVAVVVVAAVVVVVVLAVFVGEEDGFVCGCAGEIVVAMEAGAAATAVFEDCVACFGGVSAVESDGNMSEGRSDESRSPQNLDLLFSFERSCGWDCETGMFGVAAEELVA